ncbi:MAG: hypothetical protein PHF70_01390 [Opitutales bacterium]|nr:hypothetical protein [Opitutales bacterium]
MSIKELVIEKIREMPETSTFEEIEERIRFMSGVQKAINSIDSGKGISTDQVRNKIIEWTTK